MIYFIECSGRVKVGFSENPWARLGKVATDAPFPCELIGVADGDRSVEATIHDQWRHLRCHGEWFAASTDFLTWISENATEQPADHHARVKGIMAGFTIARGKKVIIAKECGVTPATVSQWQKVPAEYCEIISRITGIEKKHLRPDIFANHRITTVDDEVAA